jgi:hypothetical protein
VPAKKQGYGSQHKVAEDSGVKVLTTITPINHSTSKKDAASQQAPYAC